MPTANFKVGEMLNQRTPHSKTWMNFDGSFSVEFYARDVHYPDEYGDLQSINTDLFDEADFDVMDIPVAAEGAERFKEARNKAKEAKSKNTLNRSNHDFQALRVPFDAHIPRNFQRGYTVGKGADKMTFKPVNASPSTGEPTPTDKSIIVYQDVWNDTDVELKVLANGLKETLYLKTDKAPTSFSFEVRGRDIADDYSAGELKLRPAWLEDAAGTRRDVEQLIVRQNDNKVFVELNADTTGLIYPVAIDPTVVVADSARDAGVFDNIFSGDNFGSDETLVVYNAGTNQEIYVDVPIGDVPVGTKLVSASLNLYRMPRGGSQTPTEDVYVRASRVSGNWSESTITWDNSPSIRDEGDALTVIYKEDPLEGYVAIDVTKIVQAKQNGVTVNGIHLRHEYRHGIDNALEFDSREAPYNTPPYIEIIYSSTPSTPTLLSPNGGERWNGLRTISWTASTDADDATANLRYQIQLSTDNGVNWSTIVSQTSAGATSYNYDFVNIADTASAKLRIRADDGYLYSGWDESDAVFQIEHERAPLMPTELQPKSIPVDRAVIQRLSWKHNDLNINDAQSKFDLQWRQQGAALWTDVTVITTDEFYEFPALAFANGNIEWRVRTYDQTDLASVYSTSTVFFAGDRPQQPTFTNYGEASVVEVANPVVAWSSSGQVAYKLIVRNEFGATVWNEQKSSTAKSTKVTQDLDNEKAYTFDLSIRNADGLWSYPVVINVTVFWTPTAAPVLSVEAPEGESVIALTIVNPEPNGAQPVAAYNDIYRRKAGGAWVRIASNLTVDSGYEDFTTASGVLYDYYVRTWGGNGSYVDGNIVSAAVTIEHAELALISDYSVRVQLEYNTSTSQSKSYGRTLQRFAGRSYPMAEFSPEDTLALSTDYILKDRDALETFYALLDKKETLLYRDREGRRAFVTIGGVSEDEIGFGEWYGVSFQMDRVYVKEEV